MLRSGWRVDGDEGIRRGRFRRQAGGLAGPTLGGGREKTRRKSMGQGMKCPNIDQGMKCIHGSATEILQSRFNIIKVVFWSNLAGSNMKGWLRWARPEAGRPQIHKLISHWQIGGSDGVKRRQWRRTTGGGTGGKRCKEETQENVGTLQTPAARVTTQSSRAGHRSDSECWRLRTASVGQEWSPGQEQTEGLAQIRNTRCGGNTPQGKAGQAGRGWGPSASGERERGQGLRVLARDGQKHTFSVGSLTGLNLLGRNLAELSKNVTVYSLTQKPYFWKIIL